MQESFDEDDTVVVLFETEPDIIDPETDEEPLTLTHREIRARIVDRYEVDELVEALGVTVEDLLSDMWVLVLENLEDLDIY